MNIWESVSTVLGIGIIIVGVRYHAIKFLIKELAEAVTALSDAMEDDRLSHDELKKITREFSDVIRAGKRLIGR